jgi:hypothetical protein
MAAGRRKAARKKASAKKTTRKKVARKKAAAKKTARKKVVRKKTAAKKAARKKAAAKKTTRKKVVRKKTAAKKTARKKTTAKKTGRGGKVAKPAAPRPSEIGKPAESAAPQVVSATEGAKIAAGAPTRIGVITHYFGRVGAGVISLESGELRVGDTIHVRGHTTDFYQRVNRIELDHAQVEIAEPGQSVGVELTQRVREHDEVFKVSD